ncbi:MAG: coproporphyrinogen III oxidase family protein [Acidobacteria bacterium]|nr:coproporphyrinogen III oxidase family protein [Acidobacteriota bacterium]
MSESTTSNSTQAGNYFVSNYPPYSLWNAAAVPDALAVLDHPPADAAAPLGLYLHIPFCRKRCHFCYFKVYTDKPAAEVEAYLDTLIAEMRLYADNAFLGGRKPKFIYFGGGTPSYISSTQLKRLVESMRSILPWDAAEEIAFECEPGTITEGKLRVIKDLGITRLSLGIENFDDAILEANGRAHRSREIDRAYETARALGFKQINIDLISGMVGETPENWRECVRRTIALNPESVTIYQMEVPYNTTLFKVHGQNVAPVAGWETKREWVGYAFAEMEKAGYTIGSAYTAVREPQRNKFLYRDLLWRGADLLGLGVASFGHIQGTHMQNEHSLEIYQKRVAAGERPILRALPLSNDQRLIRELILQIKLGAVSKDYFAGKFGVALDQRFSEPMAKLAAAGFLKAENGTVRLSREGLLQVDGLLPEFFPPEHRAARVV